MLYAINGEDVPDSLGKRLSVRSAHLERIAYCRRKDVSSWRGPIPLSIAPTQARRDFPEVSSWLNSNRWKPHAIWAETDPYAAAGVYAKLTVKPFKKIMPA